MSPAYRDFADLAYRRTILAAVQRHILEFVATEVSATQSLKCEDVLAADQDVPEDAFHDYLEVLREEEEKVKRLMSQYEFRRKEPRGPKQELPPSKEDESVAGTLTDSTE